ncbi:MAG: hypothetical protein F6K25_13345 [Okeania sp. SIO2G4]|uniref:hypothetical protein n=1 Tax=unclassified Okeania TaxID=2634635 RepID=UPI0013B80A18|nr:MULTISPECIES: hypothetical protein [unclassified Okeania]NEP08362.1 hypothetical protein [Okeania sp. SIO4D6]NEP72995.1 hypothetical protein [Okeania sp. SIO2G5]NEP93759.1 hypothetical protein [Okeania sp. SIO2F5]NEQ91634.1 hypothetical protein [Okeania sp. SIO2G4]
MDWQAVLNSIDELVFQQTGKHLNNLQMGILKGVLNNEKYREIAEQYKCSNGHVKDEGYELWQVLSEIFGEKLNKSNFIATVERLGFANYHSRLFNPVQIGNLNLCSNSETAELENSNAANTQSNYKKTTSCQPIVENVLYATKLNTVSKLIKLGLTAEQVAEVVDLPLNEVQQLME